VRRRRRFRELAAPAIDRSATDVEDRARRAELRRLEKFDRLIGGIAFPCHGPNLLE